jgi:ribonuclease G
MAKEICISSTPHETRLAILEDDQLAEIYYERENEYTLAGSIYNGRVTRVLPGMQSAFVDVGLERDAFLYVTDFMELEDSEDTDEVEKAAASGANQPPREVRHAAAQEKPAARSDDRPARTAPKPEQKQEPRPERPARERRPAVEVVPEVEEVAVAAPEYTSVAEFEEKNLEDSGEPGARRWRGRRRRRGTRGQVDAPQQNEGQAEAQEQEEVTPEPVAEQEVAPAIQAAAAPVAHTEHAPAPFVLPGESLSKYGGGSDEEPAAAAAAPARPASSFKPSTLIEVPLEWDGSGLLPGESISKHRGAEQPAVEVTPEPQAVLSDASDADFEEAEELAPEPEEEQQFEESVETAPEQPKNEDYAVETVIEEASAEEPVAAAVTRQDEVVAEPVAEEPVPAEAENAEPDAAASHNVDPLPPTGFRLFGLGGKKKPDEAEPKKPAASTYAPGSGPLEEEILEEEEFEAKPHHHGKAEEHDFDFEEETLPSQARNGALGEMFQEAHLDHRIQLNLEEKNGEDEGFDEENGEDESAGAQPAASEGQGQQRRDRGGRGRRGRGAQAVPAAQAGNRRGPSRRSMQTSDLPIISDLLKPGQEILVQIAKEPIALKGARITSHIALPGRFLVFMPTVTHVGVSRKIASDEERNRLKRILVSERGDAQGGFIVRTAAEGASEEELRADLRFLIHLWNEIKQRSDSSKSPALIYHDLSLIERILRDQVSSNFSNIWVDSEANYERIVRFLNHFSPALTRRVKLYTKETPLFEHFGIQDEISKALRSKVWLKSGGSIVINQTEALVAIDINTGKYVGKSARLEDTIVKTNLDAVPEIVRQIRLRDLGGIIVIDFIDMDDRKNRYKVMAALEEALKSDRAPTKVLQFNDFGLVAITRKRVKQSLERTLSVPCPTCQATGMVKSPTTVCNEIYTELRKMKKHFEGEDVLLRVNPETVKVLKANNASWITEFEEMIGKNILIKSDPALHPEQFDIQG